MLLRQISTATAVLPTNPALHSVALGVIAGAYHTYLSHVDHVCVCVRAFGVCVCACFRCVWVCAPSSLQCTHSSRLLVVVERRYIDFLILLIPTPFVSVLFYSSIPTLCSFFKCFSFLLPCSSQLPSSSELAGALASAGDILRSLLLHSPDTWSSRILQVSSIPSRYHGSHSSPPTLQWSVDVFIRACSSRSAPSSLEEAMRHWLGHSSKAPLPLHCPT